MGCSAATGWCGRIRPGEPWQKGQCQKCWRVEHDAAARRAYGVPGPPTPVRDPADPPGRMLVIPAPPPLDLRPTRPVALVTVAAGAEGRRLHAASGPHQHRYAESIGADYHVSTWEGLASWPMSAKFGVARYLDHYEQVVYLDADVLCRPGAVDLLDLCGPDEMGVCDELPFHRAGRQGYGVEAAYVRFRRRMGFVPLARVPWCANAGVMVIPRSHRAVIEPPAELWVEDSGVGRHCAEQNLFGARLLDSGLPYRLMDRRANWQSWTCRSCRTGEYFAAAPRDALLHWSGAGGDRVHRADQIRAMAARHPWP